MIYPPARCEPQPRLLVRSTSLKTSSHLLHDLLGVLLVPPIVTFVWLLMSGGLASSLGTSDSKAVQGWTRSGFWILLSLLYAVGFAFLIYKYFVTGG